MAIKVIPYEGTSNKLTKRVMKEIEVLKACRSPHIVAYFGSCLHNNTVWVREREKKK
jgi:serine/threonine protein kinase